MDSEHAKLISMIEQTSAKARDTWPTLYEGLFQGFREKGFSPADSIDLAKHAVEQILFIAVNRRK